MSDPIGTTASLLEIFHEVSGAGRWLWRKLPWRRESQTPDDMPRQFEVGPVGFTIDLTLEVPHVEVRSYAINYLARRLSLEDVHVARFSLGDGFAIDGA